MDIRKKSQIVRISNRHVTNIRTQIPVGCQPDRTIIKYRNWGIGKQLLILGNGPSLNRISVESVKSRGLTCMGVNNIKDDFWQPEFWSVNDTQKALELKKQIGNYKGTIFSVLPKKTTLGEFIKLKNISTTQWSTDLSNGVVLGRSTVFLCLQVAFWMNFDKIFVAGIDMNPRESGNLHFYGTNTTIDPEKRKGRFINESVCYDNMIKSLSSTDLEKITLCVKGINPWPFASKLNNITPEEFNSL